MAVLTPATCKLYKEKNENQSFWLFGRDDDFAAEQFFKGLFDCGRPFDWPVDTRPVAVS